MVGHSMNIHWSFDVHLIFHIFSYFFIFWDDSKMVKTCLEAVKNCRRVVNLVLFGTENLLLSDGHIDGVPLSGLGRLSVPRWRNARCKQQAAVKLSIVWAFRCKHLTWISSGVLSTPLALGSGTNRCFLSVGRCAVSSICFQLRWRFVGGMWWVRTGQLCCKSCSLGLDLLPCWSNVREQSRDQGTVV